LAIKLFASVALRIAKLVPRRVTPDGVILRIGLGEAFGIAVALKNSFEDGRRRRAHRSVVQIDLIFGDEKQFSDFRPIRFFVGIVEAAVRQFARSMRENILANIGQGTTGQCGDAREGREKVAAANHFVSSSATSGFYLEL
jgi:hypothetical protein